MGNLFGKKSTKSPKPPEITEQDRAILVKNKYRFFFEKFLFCLAIKKTT